MSNVERCESHSLRDSHLYIDQMNARAERDLRQPPNHHGMTIVHFLKIGTYA